jgi:hypothetical protein
MKKTIKICLVILTVVIIVILGGLSYLLTGRIIPSYSCGESFDREFTRAVLSNDVNSWSNMKDNINYPAKDPVSGGFYCKPPKVGMMSDRYSIRKNDFKSSYLEAFAEATNNIEACKLIDGGGSKIVCVLGVRRATGNKDYCALITDDDLIRKKCLQ